MPPSGASEAVRTAGTVGPMLAAPLAFNGTTLNVDYAAYLSQHDVVYLAPPVQGAQGVPIGDGDLGAMLWCPGHLQMQVQKSDLWADPPPQALAVSAGLPALWRMLSAGLVSLHTEPSLLEAPTRFEQRLSLYSGLVTIQADSPHGSCQITAFAAATAGVLVIQYRDQALRSAPRWVDVSLWRHAHLFALGETIGVLQGLTDRRYALIARVIDKRATAVQKGASTARLEIEPFRSGEFTVLIAAATSPRTGDPIAVAKSRIEAAITKGIAGLLRDHRQHWSQFWQKSLLSLSGPSYDSTPNYLENLWYLGLYHTASCAHGHNAPLPQGALWLNDKDKRPGPALYEGAALRAMHAPMLPSNHLELTAPYVEMYHRLLPDVAARTGCDFGLGGARYPARLNRFGDAFDTEEQGVGCRVSGVGENPIQGVGSRQSGEGEKGNTQSPNYPITQSPNTQHPTPSIPSPGDGLATALFVWEAWRYAPDPFFLRERAYPLLRACATFALELAEAHPTTRATPEARAQLAAALRALLWASAELDEDAEQRADWKRALQILGTAALPYSEAALQPFGALAPEEASDRLREWLLTMPQLPQGFLAPDGQTPDLQRAGEFCAGLTSLLFREEKSGFAANGLPLSVLHAFPGLPAQWNGAFIFAAPGGFRISAEALEGVARYVAVQSMRESVCHFANPWGEGSRVLIREGRRLVLDSQDAVLRFETESGKTYVLEAAALPLQRAMRVRLSGRRNEAPKKLGERFLGLKG